MHVFMPLRQCMRGFFAALCPTRSGARPTRARNTCLQKYSAAVAHKSQRLDVDPKGRSCDGRRACAVARYRVIQRSRRRRPMRGEIPACGSILTMQRTRRSRSKNPLIERHRAQFPGGYAPSARRRKRHTRRSRSYDGKRAKSALAKMMTQAGFPCAAGLNLPIPRLMGKE